MADGAAGISWDEGSDTFEQEGPAEMTAKLPAVKETLEDYRQRILDGDYEVCDALNPTPVCDPLISQ
jgi:basic membrane protein A